MSLNETLEAEAERLIEAVVGHSAAPSVRNLIAFARSLAVDLNDPAIAMLRGCPVRALHVGGLR